MPTKIFQTAHLSLASVLGAAILTGCSATRPSTKYLQSDETIPVEPLGNGDDLVFEITAITARERVFHVAAKKVTDDETVEETPQESTPADSGGPETSDPDAAVDDDQGEGDQEPKLVLGTEVLLRVRAVDEHGRFVQGLNREEFEWHEVFVDGGERCEILETEITEIVEDQGPPLEVMIVADYSGSMWAHWRTLNDAVLALSDELGAKDKIGLLGFDDETEIILPLGRMKLTSSDVHGVYRWFGGGTHMYTAVAEGIASFPSSDDASPEDAIRLLVLFSDGMDNCQTCGSRDPVDLARSAVERGAQTFAVGIGDADFVALDALVRESGGYAHTLDGYRDFSDYFADMIHSAQSYYQVVIRYTCEGASPRRVRVSVQNPASKFGLSDQRVLPLQPADGEDLPPAEPEGPGIEPRPTCLPASVPSSHPVFFDVDSHQVPSSSNPDLRTIAAALACDSNSRVILEGLTDTTGSQTWNDRLAARRSEAVRTELVGLGAPSGQIDVEPLGEGPLESSRADRVHNRRVTIHWIPGPRLR